MPGPAAVPIALGISQILGNVFGNLFGASKQAGAAERAAKIQSQTALQIANLERQALDDQLAYTRGVEERDYRDWLAREARDRKDWEISEQRKAPRRALSDSAVRTLADYIRVPGMHAAQEIPVQQWTAPPPPGAVSSTMPVGGPRSVMAITGGANGGFVSPPRTLAGYTQPQAQDPVLARYGRSMASFVR